MTILTKKSDKEPNQGKFNEIRKVKIFPPCYNTGAQ